jgi:tetratricopeptide (TPR) repeat protein
VVALDPAHQNANLQLARLSVERKQGKLALEYLGRLNGEGARGAAVVLLRARALHLAGRKQEAGGLLASLEREAGGPAAWYSIGMARVEMGEFAGAELAFARALEGEPANLDILQNLGIAALRAGHAERSQQVFEAVLRAHPDDVEGLFGLGRAVAQQGRHDEAILVLAQARKLAPQRADIIYTMAATSAQAGFFGDAALAFDDYLKLRPGDEVARRDRGFAYACAGNKDEALRDLEWFAKRRPADPDGHFQLGFALTVSDQDRSFRELNEAIRLKPDHAEAHLVRGALYQHIGKPADALTDLEFAVSRRPDHIQALALLGRVYMELGRLEDAIRVLRRGYEKAPEDPRILMNLGRALFDNGQEEEGARLLEAFSKVGPDRSIERSIPGTLSLLSLPQDEWKARYEASLRTALKTRAADAESRAKLARFLLANNHREEALEHYRRVLGGAADARVLLECGRGLIEEKQYGLAREFIERSLSAEPLPGARLDLAVVLLGLEDRMAALRTLDSFPEQERQGDFYLLRAQVFDAMGDVTKAIENLNLGFRKAPTRADLYEKATHFLLKHRMDAEALSLLEQATLVLPDDPQLLFLKAVALGIRNRSQEALELLGRIIARWPEWSRPYLVRGIMEENRARSDAALKNIQAAIAMGERTPEAYYYLAQARYHLNPDEPAPAFEAIRKAVELDASDPWAQALAGRLASEMGDHETAMRHLKEAIRLKRDFVKAHFWLAGTYRAMGKEEEANAEFAEVEAIHARNPRAEEEEAPGARERLFPSLPHSP